MIAYGAIRQSGRGHRVRNGEGNMSDLEELLAAFDCGELLRPSHLVPNIVDLARAVATLAGAVEVPSSHSSESIESLIGPAEHLVFVLADGLGAEQVAALPEDAFLRRFQLAELQTVFPSSTAPAVTSFATGEWPARHGVTGWWTHIPPIGGAGAVLPFVTRTGGRSLASMGVTPDDVFLLPSLLQSVPRDSLCMFPYQLAESVYSAYLSGGWPKQSYGSLQQAADAVAARVAGAVAPTYTFVYTPLVDDAGHRYGATHARTLEAIAEVNAEMERLAAGLRGAGRLVVSADHGLRDAPPGARRRIVPSSSVTAPLRFAPSGDARILYLHLGDGMQFGDLDGLRHRLGNRFMMITLEEAESLELFGPGPIAPAVRERMGDVVAISRGRDVVSYDPDGMIRPIMAEASQHSGLSHSEMTVPLVVA